MITTHVLDTALGRPASGVPVSLARNEGGAWAMVGHGATDADGRLRTLTPSGPVEPGTYRITFDTAAYFAATGGAGFDGPAHYHVPLLLSPFGYSTYRGS